MGLVDKEDFEVWMERIMERFDHTDKELKKLTGVTPLLDGEALMDNYDLCNLLHVSKRTLQRYRSTGVLKYHHIHHKTYYKHSEVHEFIRFYFQQEDVEDFIKKKKNSKS
jgi:transcription initiation factor IIE alpha subunit